MREDPQATFAPLPHGPSVPMESVVVGAAGLRDPAFLPFTGALHIGGVDLS